MGLSWGVARDFARFKSRRAGNRKGWALMQLSSPMNMVASPLCPWLKRYPSGRGSSLAIRWEQRGFRTLKGLFVINKSKEMTKMKTAAIAVALAIGLSLSGAYAQNANDRPGMTAPQEGTMSQPNQPGTMSNPQRAPQTTGANPGNTKSMDEQAGGNNQAVERNPGGAPIGSKTNPSPR
jgi:hypothetical protein